MKKNMCYYSIAGSGTSVSGRNVIEGKGSIKNLSVLVDKDCGISFNNGGFIKVKGGGGYNFTESCFSAVIDTDGVLYDFGGEKFGEIEVI